MESNDDTQQKEKMFRKLTNRKISRSEIVFTNDKKNIKSHPNDRLIVITDAIPERSAEEKEMYI